MCAAKQHDFMLPFTHFAPPVRPKLPLRQKITAACRLEETVCLPSLIAQASFDATLKGKIANTARHLVQRLRAKHKGRGVEGLVHEYALSSHEGVALMCLAEALLRIPDHATRDALIRDKIVGGDWMSHLGGGRSVFVNAATWGLVMTGKLTNTVDHNTLGASLTGLIARCGEPVIRKGVDMAMRMMGEQFVRGETIEEALKKSAPLEAAGFRYSYDMLGEAALTADDAARYYNSYERAIHAVGRASSGKGIYQGAGISIKLSALHPRYSRSQATRVMEELLARVKTLAQMCRSYDIGFNIDAEEADRLELSLDILEHLCFDETLQGWHGIGFVVQAYGRRCPFVLDFVIDLARRSQHRLMLRLVKGAYWDSEIKHAQVEGLVSFPVYTRKAHTDIAYIACAKKLLAAGEVVFPQFATHNAQTLATIYHLAGENCPSESYEFQCLHGMGEPLYEEVIDARQMDRPVRIYAPVGTHETLLAYLVRRLLENGANSSFVHRLADKTVSLDSLVADPVDLIREISPIGAPHQAIAAPQAIFAPKRLNSIGMDLSCETTLELLNREFQCSSRKIWRAKMAAAHDDNVARPVVNPADRRDIVGEVVEASEREAHEAVARAVQAAGSWAVLPVDARARLLEQAGDAMQAEMVALCALLIREAGKTVANAVSEVREAIDFLRFYASEARTGLRQKHLPLGVVVAISPWNFPLAIFTGQIAAALVTGNMVVAKPAEETPLIAAQAVRIFHQSGVPEAVLQLVPGDGHIGAALVEDPQISGIMFTGSTEVARLIQSRIARRLTPEGHPVVLVAETGGQNAMIADSSALAEQVVGDVIASSFDSAGQRCSALRILCLQEEVASHILTMLKGALHELVCGRPDFLSTDIGPVISHEAKAMIEAHIEAMRAKNLRIEQLPLDEEATCHGSFVAPTLIELERLSQLPREIFGPVLHVIRFRREQLDNLIDDINATGYGLTFGLHTRLDETIAHVTSRIKAGNIYVNRNMIGAVVGSQPFGGRGLSGTGPKAGGPLYLGRLLRHAMEPDLPGSNAMDEGALALAAWADQQGDYQQAGFARTKVACARVGLKMALPGPVGEANCYTLLPRGRILLVAQSERGLFHQIALVLATGNEAVIDGERDWEAVVKYLPSNVRSRLVVAESWSDLAPFAGALIEGEGAFLTKILTQLAALPGPLILAQAASSTQLLMDENAYCLNWLLEEVSLSINTTAAGGNAGLMTIA